MRLLPDGPDIPAPLIAAQEKGDVLFVCGAGVSRTVGLPSFRGLVESVYRQLSEDWNQHPAEREGMREGGALYAQYDRVLRSLERRLAASDAPRHRGMRERIRGAVRVALTPPADANLVDHLTLLKLSRDAEGRSRVLTTNFDTLFERAWCDEHRHGANSYAGPAMPQPKVDAFTGVLHLHGRLADARDDLKLSETELILTSAEFGDAYLRSGWASRYVYDVVRACTVVMVGYEADDPPMRYVLEALEADRERYPDLRPAYAFAPAFVGEEEEKRALWDAKGVEAILYRPASDTDHSPLYRSIRAWRTYADDPTAWRRGAVRHILVENPTQVSEGSISTAASLLSHGDAGRILGDISPSASWIPVLAQRRLFDRADGRLGPWIAVRTDDPDVIRACADLTSIDDESRWLIDRALSEKTSNISPVRPQGVAAAAQDENATASSRGP